MIYLSIILFAVAAVLGATLVVRKFTGKGMPLSLAAAHGIFAAAGLITLAANVYNDSSNKLMNISLILFIIFALGGFILLSYHLRKKAHPVALIGIHGAGAVVSFLLLLVAVFG
jgi:lipid-A-disaccharide synthase-like uncharacterized protein